MKWSELIESTHAFDQSTLLQWRDVGWFTKIVVFDIK